MIRQPFEFPPDPARLVQTVGSLEAARPAGLPRTRAAPGAKRGLDQLEPDSAVRLERAEDRGPGQLARSSGARLGEGPDVLAVDQFDSG
jgi:hypothetical protein